MWQPDSLKMTEETDDDVEGSDFANADETSRKSSSLPQVQASLQQVQTSLHQGLAILQQVQEGPVQVQSSLLHLVL